MRTTARQSESLSVTNNVGGLLHFDHSDHPDQSAVTTTALTKPALLPPTQTIPYTLSHSTMESLLSQIQILTAVLELQEKTLTQSDDIQQHTTHSFGLFLSHYSTTTTAATTATPKLSPRVIQNKLKAFPYLRLLQTWRQVVLQSKLQESMLTKQLQDTVSRHKQERIEGQRQSTEMETQLLSWKHKAIAMREQCELLQNQQRQLAESSTAERSLHQLTSQKLQQSHSRLRSLVQFVVRVRHEHEQQQLLTQATMSQAMDKLQEYSIRAQRMFDRLQFLQTVLTEKELTRRNDQAMLVAEKSMLYSQFEQQKQQQQPQQQQQEPPSTQISTPLYAHSLPSVSVESEALLKTLFRQLDMENRGLIWPSMLWDCLVEAKTTVEGDDETPLTPIGALLCRSLGQRVFDRFLQNLDATLAASGRDDKKHEQDLSWGECLLLLWTRENRTLSCRATELVDPCAVALTRDETRRLAALSLVANIDLGVIPLSLPPLPVVATATKTACGGEAVSFSEENQRLRNERHYLMERLQSLDRSMVRRAESVKGFFENELKMLRRREESLVFELADRQDRLQHCTERVVELEQEKERDSTRLERLRESLEKENEMLRERLRLSREEEVAKYESLLASAKEHSSRLQSDLAHSERELSKREVKTKTLQRDILRLQSLQSQQSEKLAAMEVELQRRSEQLQEKERSDVRAQLELNACWQEKEQKWLIEKQELLQRLTDSQEQVITLTDHMKTQAVEASRSMETIAVTSSPAVTEQNMGAAAEAALQEDLSAPISAVSSRELPRKTSEESSLQWLKNEMKDIQQLRLDGVEDASSNRVTSSSSLSRHALDARLQRLIRAAERMVEE
jgi:hypothetical protein